MELLRLYTSNLYRAPFSSIVSDGTPSSLKPEHQLLSYRTCSSSEEWWRHLPGQLEVVFKLRKEAIRFKRSVHSCCVHACTLRMWQHFRIQPFATQHPHVVDDVTTTWDVFKRWRKRFVLQYILWIIRSTYITKTKRKVMLEMCEISQSLNS